MENPGCGRTEGHKETRWGRESASNVFPGCHAKLLLWELGAGATEGKSPLRFRRAGSGEINCLNLVK